MLQALSAAGNISARLVSMLMANLISCKTLTAENAWRYAFLIGSVPAFLCVLIQLRLHEPEKWVKAKAAGKASGVKFGSYLELLGPGTLAQVSHYGHVALDHRCDRLMGIGFFSRSWSAM